MPGVRQEPRHRPARSGPHHLLPRLRQSGAHSGPDDVADMELYQETGEEGLSAEELTQTLRLAKIQISQLATTLAT